MWPIHPTMQWNQQKPVMACSASRRWTNSKTACWAMFRLCHPCPICNNPFYSYLRHCRRCATGAGSYARKETVQGFLVPDQGVIKVYASTIGIVRQLFVQDRSLVVEGQPLFMINGDRILASGEHLEAVLLEEYQSQQQILESQLTRLPDRK